MFAASTVQHYSFWEENGEDWTVSCWLPSLSPLWELELIFENFTDCHLFCVPWVAAHASMSSSVSNLNLILQNSLWKIWIQINQLISIDVTGWHTCWPSLLPGLSSLPATVTAYTESELSDYADPVHQLLISTDISVGELRNSPNVHCCYEVILPPVGKLQTAPHTDGDSAWFMVESLTLIVQTLLTSTETVPPEQIRHQEIGTISQGIILLA